MLDFVINFNLQGGLSLDEWWKETERMEEDDKKEGDMLKWMREILWFQQLCWATCRTTSVIHWSAVPGVWWNITSNNVFVVVVKKLCKEGRDKTCHHQVLMEADFQKNQALSLNPDNNQPIFELSTVSVLLRLCAAASLCCVCVLHLCAAALLCCVCVLLRRCAASVRCCVAVLCLHAAGQPFC